MTMEFTPFSIGDSSGAESLNPQPYTISFAKDPVEVKQKLVQEHHFLQDADVQVIPEKKQLHITARKVNWPALAKTILTIDQSTAATIREIIKSNFDSFGSLPPTPPSSGLPQATSSMSQLSQQPVTPQQSMPQAVGSRLGHVVKKHWPWMLAAAGAAAAGGYFVYKQTKNSTDQTTGKSKKKRFEEELERRRKRIEKRRRMSVEGGSLPAKKKKRKDIEDDIVGNNVEDA